VDQVSLATSFQSGQVSNIYVFGLPLTKRFKAVLSLHKVEMFLERIGLWPGLNCVSQRHLVSSLGFNPYGDTSIIIEKTMAPDSTFANGADTMMRIVLRELQDIRHRRQLKLRPVFHDTLFRLGMDRRQPESTFDQWRCDGDEINFAIFAWIFAWIAGCLLGRHWRSRQPGQNYFEPFGELGL
jgi:hypothetical protein